MTFDDFDLPEPVRAGIRETGFTSPTPIQAKTLPISLAGKDVAGQAQTGTGKTAAFLISIFSRLLRGPSRQPGLPRAMVLAPTRELALQIFRDAEQLGKHTGLSMTVLFGGMDYHKHTGLSMTVLFGGMDYHKQRESIKSGADIVIATPGRLMDYYRQKILILSNIEIVVVDEADRMFDMGFIKDIRFILKRLPSWEKRQSMLFSATLSYDVMELAYEHMNAPTEVAIEATKLTAEGVEEHLIHISQPEKFHGLLRLLAHEKPTRGIIFANTKGAVEMITRRLNANEWKAGMLMGDVPQKKRLQIVHDFKEGKIQLLVATDVASRGLHVTGVDVVVNYDLPQDAEDYVHRIGRTARAGATGKAFALVDEESAFYLEGVEKYAGHKIPVGWMDDYPEVEEKRGPRPPPREFRGGRDGGRGGDRRGGQGGGGRDRRGRSGSGSGSGSGRRHEGGGGGHGRRERPEGAETKGAASEAKPPKKEPGSSE